MRANYAVRDAVEVWARRYGRHGDVRWSPVLKCYEITLTYPDDSPVMKAWRDGRVGEAKPHETIPLAHWDAEAMRYVAVDPDEYGPSGVVELLDRANAQSGRGERGSLVDAVEAQIQKRETIRRENQKKAREAGEEVGWLSRRKEFNLPLISVGTNLGPTTPPGE